ncbi:MAG: hypothetical protein AAF363_07375 [Bacteroidota bacterium]
MFKSISDGTVMINYSKWGIGTPIKVSGDAYLELVKYPFLPKG